MQHPVKISVVGYTNTIPFVYGLKNTFGSDEISLSLDIPAECARKLREGEAAIGLVPSAIVPELKKAQIISSFCIGAEKKVDSVCLYSTVPVHEIEEIMLDYQSRTSVRLIQILCKEYWKINPVFTSTKAGFEKTISGRRAAVIIGDRTFCLRETYPFIYDLAEIWNTFTGKPFVFACWVASADTSPAFLKKFNQALSFGTSNIKSALKGRLIPCQTPDETYFYLTERISYELSPDKLEGLRLFWSKL